MVPAVRQRGLQCTACLPRHADATDYEPAHLNTTTVSRRIALAAVPVAVAAVPSLSGQASADGDAVLLYVRPGPDDVSGGTYGSIADALAAAPPGATVRVAPGFYNERLIILQAVTLEAEPPKAGAPAGKSAVTLSHDTEAPYEATLQVEAPDVSVRGIQIRHTSPSIAANYAVLVRSTGALTLDKCDARSSTGSGLGVEGGLAIARLCIFTECQRHGVALYGDLLGSVAGTTVLEDCTLASNKEDGVLLRAGADAAIRGCTITGNGGVGIMAVDSSLNLLGCEVRGNRKGALKVERARSFDVETTALDAPPVIV